jgi:esterase/lipase superfamily enzyme
MDRQTRVVQAALQLRDELAGLLGDEDAASWPALDAALADALAKAIEDPADPARMQALLAAARAHPQAAARFQELLAGGWRSAARPGAPAGEPAGAGIAVDLRAGVAAPRGFEVVEILYATNRADGRAGRPAEAYGPLPAADHRVAIGRCTVTLPTDRERGELPTAGLLDLLRGEDPKRHALVASIEPLAEAAFATALTGSAVRGEALVFLHGYNVGFGDAMRRTAQLKADLAFGAIGPVIGFSWPSRASYLSYAADADATELSAPLLAAFLLRLQAWAPGLRVHVVAHSMGNRVLARAMRELELGGRAEAARVRQLALAAPDIDRAVFDALATALRSSAERVTLYASSHDRALWVSKLLHRGARAGDAGDGLVLTEGVDTIDASRTDSSLLAMNHGYFARRLSVLSDLGELLRHGTPPAARPGMRAGDSGRHWVLQP